MAPRTTAVAGFIGLMAGVAVTLASGELRADREPDRALFRANELLAERLAARTAELDAARREVELLRWSTTCERPTDR